VPWSFERKVIYPAGWCRGPVNYGEQLALSERVWQAYQTAGGNLKLRRAAEDLSHWDWEDDLPLYEHEGLARHPDVTFDKAGQPEAAFEKTEQDGSIAVWIRRITEIEGIRTVVIDKVVENAGKPKLYRDPDNDILLFYVKEPEAEGGDKSIAYRVQSEGWATERAVAGTVNPKSILDVSMVRDYRLVLTYAKDEEHVIGYVVTDRYPIVAIEKVGVGGLANEIRFVPVVNFGSEDVVGVGAIADLLDIVGLNLFLEYEEGVGVGATANMLRVIVTVEYPLDDTVKVQSKADLLKFVPIEDHLGENTLGVGATANLLTIEAI
jgi:hypothetical protein